jgi:ABC-type phosphate transport system substrate-binding protein
MRMLKIAVVGAAAAALIGIGLGPALADPPAGVTPKLCSIVGVGAQSTARLMDAMAAVYDKSNPGCPMYSWDGQNPVTAQPGGTIVTKGSSPTDMTCAIARPDNSSSGVEALAAAKIDLGFPCINFARSESPPSSTSPTGLVWVGFALDAVSWITTTKAAGAPATLTAAQLNAIYSCKDRTWRSVGGTSTADIVPGLPQASSDTRPFFLAAIGNPTLGSCVVNGSIDIPSDPDNPVPLQENTGVSATSTGVSCTSAKWAACTTGNAYWFAHNADALYPYSAADWIAQAAAPAGGGHASPVFAHGLVTEPKEISGVSPITAGSPDTISKAFETGTATLVFTHSEYNVVPNVGTIAAPEIAKGPITTIFGPKGVVCSNSTIIESFGFGTLGSRCGFLVAG